MEIDLRLAQIALTNWAANAAYRLDIFLDSTDDLLPDLIQREALHLVNEMSQPDRSDPVRDNAAQRALAVVVAPEPQFWATDLGRLIAQRIGYGHEVVPRPHAAAILGVSRQRVHQLERTGVLSAVPGGIFNESLLTRLHEAQTAR